MMREQQQALQQLARAQMEAANRHRVMEQVMQGHVDRMAADADRMHQAMAAAGHQRTNALPAKQSRGSSSSHVRRQLEPEHNAAAKRAQPNNAIAATSSRADWKLHASAEP
jgi:hypothetical protein